MRRGLTLVEVLVALAVLGVVLGFVAPSLFSSLQVARQSRVTAVATEYAQGVVERYRTHWSVPANYIAGSAPPGLEALRGRLAQAGLNASIDATQRLRPDGSAFTGTGQPPLRRVVVEVRRGNGVVLRLVSDIGHPQSGGLR